MAQQRVLEATGLTKTYRRGGIQALADFGLILNEGEIVGLLGPNGAGKTTAISIMCSLLKPDRGLVKICGRPLHGSSFWVKSRLGLVPQHNALYPGLTGRENLHYFGRLYGLRGRGLKDRVAEMLDFAGLTDQAEKRISDYSGGMKRRANLVVGILHNPRILFLDEPTVGIDAQSRNLILETLIDLRNQGMSMVYTSHYMEEIERICDRVSIVDHGHIVSEGRPRQLLEENRDCLGLEDLFLKLTGTSLRD